MKLVALLVLGTACVAGPMKAPVPEEPEEAAEPAVRTPKPQPDAAAREATAPDAPAAPDAALGPDLGNDRAVLPDSPAVAGCQGARLCDDFESYAPGAAPGGGWRVTKSATATVAVDGRRAFSGARSVRFTVPAGASRNALMGQQGAPVFPLPANAMYGRMMMWVEQAPPVPSLIHWDNIVGEGTVGCKGYRAFFRYGGMRDRRLLANYFAYTKDVDYVRESERTLAEKRWICLEWRFDGAGGQSHLWVDGVPLPELSVTTPADACTNRTNEPWLFPTFDAVRVGWQHFQDSPIPYELWIDDVAIGLERIGCPTR